MELQRSAACKFYRRIEIFFDLLELTRRLTRRRSCDASPQGCKNRQTRFVVCRQTSFVDKPNEGKTGFFKIDKRKPKANDSATNDKRSTFVDIFCIFKIGNLLKLKTPIFSPGFDLLLLYLTFIINSESVSNILNLMSNLMSLILVKFE